MHVLLVCDLRRDGFQRRYPGRYYSLPKAVPDRPSDTDPGKQTKQFKELVHNRNSDDNPVSNIILSNMDPVNKERASEQFLFY